MTNTLYNPNEPIDFIREAIHNEWRYMEKYAYSDKEKANAMAQRDAAYALLDSMVQSVETQEEPA